jgi:hypothetical protein
MGKPRLASLTAASLALLSASCVLGPAPGFAKNILDGGYCAAAPAGATATRATPEEVTLSTRVAEERGYSPRALDTARAIGAASALERLAEAEVRNADRAAIADLRGLLNDAIFFASLELESIVARLRCEQGRADQITADLQSAEEEQTRRLTAYSLVVSAASAIGAGVLAMKVENETPSSLVGIGGGVLGGALGFATLAVHRETVFPHAPNHLGQLWYGGTNHPDFPAIVWAYLTRPHFTQTGNRAVRDILIETWKQSGRLGPNPAQPDPKLVALYFGQGGTYDAAELDNRSNMLSELREATALMTYDLQLLAREAMRR